jgi:hypothetical protein
MNNNFNEYISFCDTLYIDQRSCVCGDVISKIPLCLKLKSQTLTCGGYNGVGVGDEKS